MTSSLIPVAPSVGANGAEVLDRDGGAIRSRDCMSSINTLTSWHTKISPDRASPYQKHTEDRAARFLAGYLGEVGVDDYMREVLVHLGALARSLSSHQALKPRNVRICLDALLLGLRSLHISVKINGKHRCISAGAHTWGNRSSFGGSWEEFIIYLVPIIHSISARRVLPVKSEFLNQISPNPLTIEGRIEYLTDRLLSLMCCDHSLGREIASTAAKTVIAR